MKCDVSQNLANPMIGCGVQQTRGPERGASRRSREKRHGRKVQEGWLPTAERASPSGVRAGTGRARGVSMEGIFGQTPREDLWLRAAWRASCFRAVIARRAG